MVWPMLFLPHDVTDQSLCFDLLKLCAEKIGLKILGFRKVPVNNAALGITAISVEPAIWQAFIERPQSLTTVIDFDRKLFVFKNLARKTIVKAISQAQQNLFYFCSCSSKTIIYKGQLTSTQVRNYFLDLSDPDFMSSFGLIHSRFATNTFPSWKLAQPFRYIAHNGEINTLQGNVNWFNSQENSFHSPYFSAEEMAMIKPIIGDNQSDSACLDNVVELLTLCGRSLPHVMMMLIPEAWDNDPAMDQAKRAFYEFHASIMEPWDGPASISFTDGNIIGATLDRNGLRPSRYTLTHDDRIIMSSETGVLNIDPKNIKAHGRLQPGKMFIVDLEKGIIISDEALKKDICNQKPYQDYLDQFKIELKNLANPRIMFTALSDEQLIKYQKAFGYSDEDIDDTIIPMALSAQEPIGSMGIDIPLAILSHKPQHICSYFKQYFAQVTNPPIDPIREKLVMSLVSYVGGIGNLMMETPEDCKTLALDHPILSDYELEKVRSIDLNNFQTKTIQSYFRADGKPNSLKEGLDRLCRYTLDAVKDNFKIIIITDRAIDSAHCPIPSLLACSAIHHFLIREGLRGKVGLIVECGDIWEVHHFACLIGYGATAINPYLALSIIQKQFLIGKIKSHESVEKLQQNYIQAVNYGLLKIFSKMGISTLQSYQGAQTFEILGLHQDLVDTYFTGTVSRIGGLNLDDLAEEALQKQNFAFHSNIDKPLIDKGIWQWKRTGEYHLMNPQTIHLLQLSTRTKDYKLFKKYAQLIDDQKTPACALRHLFKLNADRPAIPLSEVEPVENILKRFASGAMSFGSISWEAHTTLAIAMNRIGGKSNTGEGGEDEQRYTLLPNGDNMRSAIKQVASARFGVTSNYLTQADELQIKIAQGAKPGEGGQLPGHKVDAWIGKTRHSIPGVGLISPPPHHDIYSIEDLAQLIFDLKNANPDARINVKLVSKAGVGTIAAGVVKAKADVVLISGFDGGTGASPLSSIKDAGLPWELGLAETHQTLVKNGLRSRVVVQTDGQLRTGRDIAIATLLGAEEWGIATAALIVEGCILMRKCHLNTCPVGVATQDPELRKRFTGEAEHVVNFFHFIAENLREVMAELGFRTVNEMVGQTQVLSASSQLLPRYKKINFDAIFAKSIPTNSSETLYQSIKQIPDTNNVLDLKLISMAQDAFKKQIKISKEFPIHNLNRTTGTMLSHIISKKYQSQGLPENLIHYKFKGTAGQSLAAFATKGLFIELEGVANDYVGKGLSGATLVIYPPQKTTLVAEHNSLIGNVAFYGATSGFGYLRGLAGERFAVRNSGAKIVVEGVGDHACEYMTNGTAIILGNIGRNFGAGMSGGLAFIYQPIDIVKPLCNLQTIDLHEVETKEDIDFLKHEIEQHFKLTQSAVAKAILKNFKKALTQFTKVYPKEFKRIQQQKL